uniref:Uncharacterized protein n=1 Tax=Ananas comosus var. bracteatus TaxID=296719 RepID=A0A6V7QTZ8_ANACO
MSEASSLQTLPPDAPTFPTPLHNPNPNPNPNPNANHPSSSSPSSQQWMALARAWLSSLPPNHTPTASEVDSWIDSHLSSSPTISAPSLARTSIRGCSPRSPLAREQVEFPYRFQRTDLWKPVYGWLESLDKDVLVNGKEISEWLSSNPNVMERLFEKHSRYHLMHYIQRLHLKLLKKKGKLPKIKDSVHLVMFQGLQLSAARASLKVANSGTTSREVPTSSKFSVGAVRDNKVLSKRKKLFSDINYLQNQLSSVVSKHKPAIDTSEARPSCTVVQKPETNISSRLSDTGKKDGSTRNSPRGASCSQDVVRIHVSEQSKPKQFPETKFGQKRKRNPIIVTPAWSYSETSCGASRIDQPSSSQREEGRKINIWKGDTSPFSQRISRKNILICLDGREKGDSWPMACSRGCYAGRNRERWVPFFEGWRSLGSQFEGSAVTLERRSYSSWIPTWCAYMSSAAVAHRNGRQGVQKVLNVRFHPEGLPQLVCCSNQTPNELLLYNLRSGRAIQLNGHNCQIQSIDFAVRGASVVSCGSNLLKVWDCITGSCLYTLGGDDQASVGHTQKINAMIVNKWQSCLVVTSGAKGDGKLLLWNALRGELATDLNSCLRSQDLVYPSINVMEFCSENLLACGSDCEYGGAAVVQLWDIESPESCLTFPANDSYITSLKINPAGNTLITGAGDGTIGLFDMRTCGAINHLSVGPGYEVTSVSFSSCGTYFAASSTSNNTLVWDTRLLPMNHRQMSTDVSRETNDMRFFRPLHCLSHGRQMPTAEQTGQLPGHVNEGDQGVNDARWLRNEPVLVSVSGDGSMAMWDVTLGQPLVRRITSHTRCINAVAVAPNDEYICTGGTIKKSFCIIIKVEGLARIGASLTL